MSSAVPRLAIERSTASSQSRRNLSLLQQPHQERGHGLRALAGTQGKLDPSRVPPKSKRPAASSGSQIGFQFAARRTTAQEIQILIQRPIERPLTPQFTELEPRDLRQGAHRFESHLRVVVVHLHDQQLERVVQPPPCQ